MLTLSESKNIRKATLEAYGSVADKIRGHCRRLLTNIFLSAQELSDLFAKKECLLFTGDGAVFILIPYHETYYDLLFLASNYQSLEEHIELFTTKIYDKKFSIRVSIIGKESFAAELSLLFENKNFFLSKKLGRTDCRAMTNEAAKEFIASCSAELLTLGISTEFACPEDASVGISTEFACPEDASVILKILSKEFDLLGENVPELEEIENNINQKQVAVARKNGNIIGLKYFTMKNKTVFWIYDYTQKEFRALGVNFLINNFVSAHFKRNGIQIARAYGWREVARKRLVRVYESLGEKFDGVYIYNLIFERQA